jgi:hypothetical protein
VVAADGTAWHSEENWLAYTGWDTEPHPVRLGSGVIALAWPRGSTQTNMQVHVARLDPPTGIVETGHDEGAVAADNVDGPQPLRSWPNPFSVTTSMAFAAPIEAPTTLAIHDVAGRLVRSVRVPAGSLEITWDGRDSDGRSLPSGIYFVRLGEKTRVSAARLVLLR